MIKEPFDYGGTYFSNLNYPEGRGLMYQNLTFDRELQRIGNTMHLKITVSYVMEDFHDTKIKVDVFKSQSSYQVETDGNINTSDAYKIFHHAMVCLLQGLADIEHKTQTPPTTNLHPLPFEDMTIQLEALVRDFGIAGQTPPDQK